MTAPVEMTYEGDQQASMAFLYRNTGQGTLGSDAEDQRVEVRQIEQQTAVSIGVRGSYSKKHFNEAVVKLNTWLDENKNQWQANGEPRLLGYNSPFVPWFLRYSEVQIPVEPASDTE